MSDPLVNQHFGNYFIQQRVQSGGMAIVYKAFDQRRQQIVALKILQENFIDKPQIVLRFRREAEIAQRLNHPHIVPFYDFGEIGGKLYMTMKFMDGGSLSDRLQKIANTPLGQTMRMLRQVAGALDFAHAEGIIHRDMKPGNILLDESGEAYLSDFGIARISEATQLTVTGQGMPGTARYMSPEQAKGDSKIDYRSDIYSFGVIAYLLSTGFYPFTGDNDTVVVVKHINELPPLPTAVNTSLPPALDDVLMRCLAKEPAQRQISTGAFVAEMERAIAGYEDLIVIVTPRAVNPASSSTGSRRFPAVAAVPTPISSPAVSVPSQPFYTNPVVWIGVVIIALLVALLAIQFLPGDESTAPTEAAGLPTDNEMAVPSDVPSDIPSSTEDLAATAEQATLVAGATRLADQETADAQATIEQAATDAQATVDRATMNAQATNDQETVDAQAVIDQETVDAEATMAQETADAEATVSQATLNAQLTANIPTDTPEPTDTATNTPEPTDTPVPTDTATDIPTDTPIPTNTPTDIPTDTPVPTDTATDLPTNTPVPTDIPTDTPIPTSTRRPTDAPTTDGSGGTTPALDSCQQADLNENGMIDIFDIRLLSRVYGAEEGDADYQAIYDFDENGVINILDLRRISSQYGQSCSTDE